MQGKLFKIWNEYENEDISSSTLLSELPYIYCNNYVENSINTDDEEIE